jgi:hypothetical protein
MPDAPPLLDPVSDIWEAAKSLQHALTSLQRIEAFTMGAFAIKQMVSPSHFQFNPVAFHQPGFHPSAFNPTFQRHVFRPPTFHPPDVHPKIISSPKLQGNPECNYFV